MTKEIRYNYDSVPTIRAFAQSNAFIRGLVGAFGSGKSSGSIVEIIRRAQAQKPGPDGIRRSRWGVVRNTYSELRDTTMRTVFQWLPIEHFGKFYVSDHRYVVKAFEKCEFEIMFRALDKPDDIGKLLSLELTGGWINEAREVPWAVVDALQARVDRYPAKMDGGCSWAGIWMDTNPPDADSKFYKFFEERTWLAGFQEMQRAGTLPHGVSKPEDYAAIFKQPGGRSPEAENLPNLSSGYYDRLALGKSPEWVKVYVDGQYGFVMDGKAVFPEYNDRAHCLKIDPMEGPVIYRGWDFGLTPACVFAQILPDGRFLVFDEIVSDNMGIDRFSDQVLNHCARSFPPKVRFEDYGDPAGEQRAQTDEKTVFSILQAKGINIEAGEQSPSLRLESVRKPLNTMIAGEPQFVLNPRCKTLRKGFQGGYHYRRMNVRGERFVDEPNKNEFSHCLVGGTLVSTPQGFRTIEDIRPGDLVDTPLGPRAVVSWMSSIADEVMMVGAGDRNIICTPDHPVWAGDCFVRADALQCGDTLWSNEWEKQNIRSKNSTASAITAMAAAIIEMPRLVNTCTAKFGGFTMARSLRDIASTTSIMIRQTIGLRTSPLCLSATMPAFIPANFMETQQTSPGLSCTWPKFRTKPRNGTDLRKAGFGISTTAGLSWLRARLRTMFAPNAELPIALSKDHANEAFAPLSVNPQPGVKVESTTWTDRASSAAHPSALINTRRPKSVAKVVALNSKVDRFVPVFDLTVEEAHCFYANGILVGNCHDALQYVCTRVFGNALTTRSFDDFGAPRIEYGSDVGRSGVTGY